jgi:hypothetical protein
MNKIMEYNGAPWPARKGNNLEVDRIMIMLVKCSENVYMVMQMIN